MHLDVTVNWINRPNIWAFKITIENKREPLRCGNLDSWPSTKSDLGEAGPVREWTWWIVPVYLVHLAKPNAAPQTAASVMIVKLIQHLSGTVSTKNCNCNYNLHEGRIYCKTLDLDCISFSLICLISCWCVYVYALYIISNTGLHWPPHSLKSPGGLCCLAD